MDREPLDPARLRAALGGRWAAVDVVDETTSTNADLLAAAARGAADRTLLAAETQVAGRGRFDRVWTSPPGAGLLVSLLVRPATPLVAWGWLPLLAGVALARAVRAEAGIDAVLKWPNDLLTPDGGKLAGILVQAAEGAAVIGIGLNVSTTAAELPVDTASSLALAGAPAVDRTALLAAIASAVDEQVSRWDAAGGDAQTCGLLADYTALCDTLGRQVRVSLGGGEVRVSLGGGEVLEGTAEAVADGGGLQVRAGQQTHVVNAGDVEHLRPA